MQLLLVRGEGGKCISGTTASPFPNTTGRPTHDVKPQDKQIPSAYNVNSSMRHDRGINQF